MAELSKHVRVIHLFQSLAVKPVNPKAEVKHVPQFLDAIILKVNLQHTASNTLNFADHIMLNNTITIRNNCKGTYVASSHFLLILQPKFIFIEVEYNICVVLTV